jgi:hypothetical protein
VVAAPKIFGFGSAELPGGGASLGEAVGPEGRTRMPPTMVRGLQGWRIGATIGVLLFASAVTACTASEAETALPPAPKPTSTVSECPTTFDTAVDSLRATRRGQLVPTGASGALLCTYRDTDGSVLPLTLSTASTEPPSVVVAQLNALSPRTATGEQIIACSAMGRTMYVIVLTYPDDTGVEVRVDLNCSSAEQGGAVGFLRKSADLLSAWPEKAW